MLVKVGVYCLRGQGHWACADEEDWMACGSKGPDVLIDVDIEDFDMYPPWLQERILAVRPEWAARVSR